MNHSKVFRIGAADSSGHACGNLSPDNLGSEYSYLFPGNILNVLDSDEDQLRLDMNNLNSTEKARETRKTSHTGSSVATALAAGLAALPLHCAKLGVYVTDKKEHEPWFEHHIRVAAIENNTHFKKLSNAFQRLCINNDKYVDPGDAFKKTVKSLGK
ncbi:hypothetical protein F4861DRAFT_520442 [Xylaria intraflava]|nr:hypothetical protein F4861DRAFT_520442 [Xylaria intraflava]